MHRQMTGIADFRRAGVRGTCFLLAAAVALLGGCKALTYSEGRSALIAPYESGISETSGRGAARFLFDDFHGLSTDTLEQTALPWKLATTALVIARYPNEAPTLEHLQVILTQFGFIYPDRIANWPLHDQPALAQPIGLVRGDVVRRFPKVRLEVANLGCAGCHAGVLHDANGKPTRSVWLGVPNTSLDIDAYVAAVTDAIVAVSADEESALAALRVLYPDTRDDEISTLRRFVWPRLMKRLPQLRSGEVLAFRNGGPGRSNGVEALKLRLGAGAIDRSAAATVSIPELACEPLRSALLSDGLYAPNAAERFAARHAGTADDPMRLADIVGFFTVSTMGVKPSRVPSILPHIGEVMTFLRDAYQPPPFPGQIDTAKAVRGAQVYAGHCASCHGEYAEIDGHAHLVSYPNQLVELSKIGTDPGRNQAISPELLNAISHSTFHHYVDATHTDGYLAPVLSGIWTSAPYLHNGSVPTLWHLMHPDKRPDRFQVGGHALDYRLVGIAGVAESDGVWGYPADYAPWSAPKWFDASVPGQSNRGHERMFESLDESDKDDLLEYLKRL
jgi:hypothetical protein